MKKRNLVFFLSGLLMLAACGGGSDHDDPVPTPPNQNTDDPKQPENPSDPENPGGNTDTTVVKTRGIVAFLPSLSAMTRASDTQFDAGDQIGVFAMRASEGDQKTVIANKGSNYADNVVYTYNAGKFTNEKGIEIPGDAKLFYTAVYPYTADAANSFSFEVKKDQAPSGAYTASDLCSASTGPTDAKEVNLKFDHRLSKVVINLTGDGWTSSNVSVIVKNVMTKANVNLNDMTFVGIGEKADIACASNGTLSYKFILPPQIIEQGEKFITVTMNGVDYSYGAESKLEFTSGKSYEYTFTLNKTPEGKELVLFTGDINPWNVDERINDVVPEDIQDKMGPYITIYRGNKPPHIEGTVYINPFVAVYCEDEGNGGYTPGTQVNSHYIRFSNQSFAYNTIDIDEMSEGGTSSSTGTGAFISGTGDNFTAFFNTIGSSNGISTKTALVISGTKVAGGISNLRYAFVMVEKGSDPEGILMREGVFRVFQDQDAISEYVSWPGASARSTTAIRHLLTPYSRYAK